MPLHFHCRSFHRSYFTHLHHCSQSCPSVFQRLTTRPFGHAQRVTEHLVVNIRITHRAADDPTDRTTAKDTFAEKKRKRVTVT